MHFASAVRGRRKFGKREVTRIAKKNAAQKIRRRFAHFYLRLFYNFQRDVIKVNMVLFGNALSADRAHRNAQHRLRIVHRHFERLFERLEFCAKRNGGLARIVVPIVVLASIVLNREHQVALGGRLRLEA